MPHPCLAAAAAVAAAAAAALEALETHFETASDRRDALADGGARLVAVGAPLARGRGWDEMIQIFAL